MLLKIKMKLLGLCVDWVDVFVCTVSNVNSGGLQMAGPISCGSCDALFPFWGGCFGDDFFGLIANCDDDSKTFLLEEKLIKFLMKRSQLTLSYLVNTFIIQPRQFLAEHRACLGEDIHQVLMNSIGYIIQLKKVLRELWALLPIDLRINLILTIEDWVIEDFFYLPDQQQQSKELIPKLSWWKISRVSVRTRLKNDLGGSSDQFISFKLHFWVNLIGGFR